MAKTTVKFFHSLSEFCAFLTPEAWGNISSQHGAHFLGAGSLSACVKYVLQGADESEQVKALALLDKIDSGVHGRKRNETVNSVAGEQANIGAYLRGEPQNMRRKVRVEHERSPIRIFVEVSVSGGVSNDELETRGAVCAALAIKLAEIRPVELWACWSSSNGHREDSPRIAGAVKLDTNPLSMATAVAVLAKSQFTRGLRFAALATVDPSKRWDIVCSQYSERGRAQVMRDTFGMEPQDIYIPGGSLEYASQWTQDPVAWVNGYLDSQREAE